MQSVTSETSATLVKSVTENTDTSNAGNVGVLHLAMSMALHSSFLRKVLIGHTLKDWGFFDILG